jgi:hypothetical protein
MKPLFDLLDMTKYAGVGKARRFKNQLQYRDYDI